MRVSYFEQKSLFADSTVFKKMELGDISFCKFVMRENIFEPVAFKVYGVELGPDQLLLLVADDVLHAHDLGENIVNVEV